MNEIQPELFDQFIDANKPKEGIHRRIMRKGLPPHFSFTLSYEKVIISIIVLISLVIVSFSLGIERGKKLSDFRASLPNDAAVVEVTPVRNRIPKADVPPRPDVPPRRVDVSDPPKETRFYTIQVAAFRRKALAEREVSRLERLNYEAFSSVSGRFHLVFVGNYATRELAKKDLGELRKIYKDCFIIKRR